MRRLIGYWNILYWVVACSIYNRRFIGPNGVREIWGGN